MYKLILLDRDGVINKKLPVDNYITSWEEFEFLPKVKEAISILSKKYKIGIITNQRGIARGFMTVDDLNNIHKKMTEEIKINKIYYCPHDKNECECRKPKPGMVLKALKDFNLNANEIIILGDSFKDYETAKNAGCDFIFIDTFSDERDGNIKKFKKINPKTFSNLYEATLFLTK